MNQNNRINYRLLSHLIGLSFISMFPLGIFAEFVRTELIVWENSLLTVTNIQNSLGLFELSILAWLAILMLDTIIAIALYILVRPVHQVFSKLMLSLRLIYVSIKGFALVGLLLARNICSTSMQLTTEQSSDEFGVFVMQFLRMHQYGFGIGLCLFGLHLILLGYLLYQLKGIPKILIWLLIAAGFGYFANSLVSLFAPNHEVLLNVIIPVFIIPMTLAELALGVWLWIKGRKLSSIFAY